MGGVWTVRASVVACDSPPALPVNVTVAAPVEAVVLAASVTFCAVPGVSVGDAGLAVTPAGKPAIPMTTGEAKPFIAVACKASAVPVVPSTSVCDVGVTVREKSGGGGGAAVVVNATVVLRLSVPEVPVSVTVAAPVAIVASAVKVIFCATPGIRVSVAGLAVTPAGNPPGETVTAAANPFIALAVTLIDCPAAPPITEAVAGETPRLKSGVGVGALEGIWVPPQPVIADGIDTRRVRTSETSSPCLRMPVPPRGRRGRRMHDRADA
jgi:hypothetical protein